MDETVRGILAQAIRDAFASSGIDPNEEYIGSLISKVDDDGMVDNLSANLSGVGRTLVLQGHLAIHDANTEKSPL
ncbi:hypothetical protein N7456_007112 [Penicillium angulare]|uniref:Uncharacterized protein n=1 Tax=Penicillium angulare TaxID=116970 RepID=A0A9W9FJ06_9EURO|nr:hypothetical protein N7456_007112 [Penicillium angulare]